MNENPTHPLEFVCVFTVHLCDSTKHNVYPLVYVLPIATTVELVHDSQKGLSQEERECPCESMCVKRSRPCSVCVQDLGPVH